ncbi:MAG TPA: hypothetical protein VK211_12005 [Kamptonema sp.]|nr:hypothetical protein [Kamptonema sp.]
MYATINKTLTFEESLICLPTYSRRKKEEGRRKKDEVIIARVSAIKIVLTALAVAITLTAEQIFAMSR